MLDLNQLILANGIVSVGAFIQGSIGIGFALVASPILIMIDQAFIPTPSILSGLLLSILIFYRDRASIDFFGLKLSIIGRVFGTFLGAGILLIVSKTMFAYIFALSIIIAVVICASGVTLLPTGPKLLGAGFLAGFMATTTSVGGPPMALIYQNSSGPTIRSTLSCFFIVGTIISLIVLAIIGKFRQKEILAFISILPGILIGFSFSKYGAKLIDKGYMKKAILLIAFLSSVAIILRELL